MTDDPNTSRPLLDTRAVHAGETPRHGGALVTPIYQTAMFENREVAGYHDVPYLRLNNSPNHRAVQDKLAALESGAAALVLGSGMAAISTTLLTALAPGGHLLAQQVLYGGTHDLLDTELPRLGIAVSRIDASRPADWAAALRPNSRAIYVETLTNPLLELAELDAIVAFAQQHGLLAIIDNTFASPVNYRPLQHGFDVVLHSATKYLNGHSDLVAGAVVGSAAFIEEVRRSANVFGATLDPHACFLLQRGMKTLGVRVRQQNATALTIARYLERHPGVRRVHYPGLPSHVGHARACQWLDGFGGMLAFELDSAAAAASFVGRLRTIVHAVSLGGVESLATAPAISSHANVPTEELQRIGITPGLIRFSVGLEAAADLLADLDQALAAL